MAPVVAALRATDVLDVRLLATAQHRGLLDQQLAFFCLVPDRDLDVMVPEQSLTGLTASLLSALAPALHDERPDLVIVQGDTTTVLATALASHHARLPIAHVEAGLRSGDRNAPFPEEANRTLVSHLADLHFCPTAGARDHLLREGLAASAIHVVGNPVVDALAWTRDRVDAARFAPAPGRRLLLVTAHRREHFGAPFAAICAAVRALADRQDVDVLFPVHPNPRVYGPAHQLLGTHPRIRLVAPLDYPDMVAAMLASSVILTDSGGVQEEAPSLPRPVVVLRDRTERPEGVAAGRAVLVGTDRDRIVGAVTRLLDDPAAAAAMTRGDNPYGDGRAGPRIAAIVRDFLSAR